MQLLKATLTQYECPLELTGLTHDERFPIRAWSPNDGAEVWVSWDEIEVTVTP